MTDKKQVTIDETALPDNWKVATLSDITDYIQRGKSPKYIGHSDLPVINQKCIRWFGIEKEHLKYVHPDQWEKWAPQRYVQEGDILWNSTGTGTIGRAAVIKHLAPGEKYVVDSHVTIVRPKEVEPLYVHYWIMSHAVQGSIEAMQSGSTNQVELSKAAVEALPIPVAPLEQQKRIVAEIEKQFSRLDEAVANLKRVKTNLKRYKAAVLKAAVEGKLTEGWRKQHPDVEPASKLLERILVERREKWEESELAKMKAKGKAPEGDMWRKKYKEPATPDTTDLPELPGGWNWVSMDSLIVWGPQNGLYLPKTAYKPGIAILRIDDYQDGHSREVAGLQQVGTTEENVERYGLELNDFIINRVNSPSHLGKCIVIKARNLPSLFESNMMRLKLASSVRAEYIELYFHSKSGKTRLIENAKWAVNQASINQGDVSMTIVPLPPEKEQELIVNEVESKLAIVAGIEDLLETNMRRSERLRQSILSKSFSGGFGDTTSNAFKVVQGQRQ